MLDCLVYAIIAWLCGLGAGFAATASGLRGPGFAMLCVCILPPVALWAFVVVTWRHATGRVQPR